jgi:hypothetical protein
MLFPLKKWYAPQKSHYTGAQAQHKKQRFTNTYFFTHVCVAFISSNKKTLWVIPSIFCLAHGV